MKANHEQDDANFWPAQRSVVAWLKGEKEAPGAGYVKEFLDIIEKRGSRGYTAVDDRSKLSIMDAVEQNPNVSTLIETIETRKAALEKSENVKRFFTQKRPHYSEVPVGARAGQPDALLDSAYKRVKQERDNGSVIKAREIVIEELNHTFPDLKTLDENMNIIEGRHGKAGYLMPDPASGVNILQAMAANEQRPAAQVAVTMLLQRYEAICQQPPRRDDRTI